MSAEGKQDNGSVLHSLFVGVARPNVFGVIPLDWNERWIGGQ